MPYCLLLVIIGDLKFFLIRVTVATKPLKYLLFYKSILKINCYEKDHT